MSKALKGINRINQIIKSFQLNNCGGPGEGKEAVKQPTTGVSMLC